MFTEFSDPFTAIILPLLKQYPEIRWFANEGVAATQESPSSRQPKGYTQQLAEENPPLVSLPKSGGKYVELERMLSSIVFYHWIKDGRDESYNALIANQDSSVQLTKASYQELSQFFNETIKSQMLDKAIETMLIFSDAGKTPTAKNNAKAEGLFEADHDDFIEALLHLSKDKIASVLPSFSQLLPDVQDYLIKASSAMPIHTGHVLHIEGGPRMFTKFAEAIKANKVTLELLNFAFVIQLCDVAAAQAHIDNRGSMSLTEHTYQGYQLVRKTLANMITGGLTPEQALNDYVTLRAALMNVQDSTPTSKFLVRIACWLRLYTPADYQLLENAFNKLSPQAKNLAIAQFDLNGGFNLWHRNPTYGPAVLVNLGRFLEAGESKQAKIDRAIEGAACLAQWFAAYKDAYETSSSPINLNAMAGTAAKEPGLFRLSNFNPKDFVPNERNEVIYKKPVLEEKTAVNPSPMTFLRKAANTVGLARGVEEELEKEKRFGIKETE